MASATSPRTAKLASVGRIANTTSGLNSTFTPIDARITRKSSPFKRLLFSYASARSPAGTPATDFFASSASFCARSSAARAFSSSSRASMTLVFFSLISLFFFSHCATSFSLTLNALLSAALTSRSSARNSSISAASNGVPASEYCAISPGVNATDLDSFGVFAFDEPDFNALPTTRPLGVRYPPSTRTPGLIGSGVFDSESSASERSDGGARDGSIGDISGVFVISTSSSSALSRALGVSGVAGSSPSRLAKASGANANAPASSRARDDFFAC